MLSIIKALLILSVSAIEPRFVPSFIIDFDQPASIRYDELFNHFKDTILQMESYFYYAIPPQIRGFYGEGDNLEKFRQAQPDVYEAMERLAEVLGLPVL